MKFHFDALFNIEAFFNFKMPQRLSCRMSSVCLPCKESTHILFQANGNNFKCADKYNLKMI